MKRTTILILSSWLLLVWFLLVNFTQQSKIHRLEREAKEWRQRYVFWPLPKDNTNVWIEINPTYSPSEISNRIAQCPSGRIIRFTPGMYRFYEGFRIERDSKISIVGAFGPNGENLTWFNFGFGSMMGLGELTSNYFEVPAGSPAEPHNQLEIQPIKGEKLMEILEAKK